ncbi:hypothetical protein KPL74_19025 [Bacillus sp. NP157]|nr:hypothetical protein KPL74_19025 [Bacillus sp. NP157]
MKQKTIKTTAPIAPAKNTKPYVKGDGFTFENWAITAPITPDQSPSITGPPPLWLRLSIIAFAALFVPFLTRQKTVAKLLGPDSSMNSKVADQKARNPRYRTRNKRFPKKEKDNLFVKFQAVVYRVNHATRRRNYKRSTEHC